MSKIYKALEKAQREHGTETPSDLSSFLGMEEKKEGGAPALGYEPQKLMGGFSDERLVSFFQPTSLSSEQFRKLRTQLLRLKISNPPRTILVTSASNGEGKTLVAANLAAGIAYDFHAHALLVDCDLRNPMLGRWFGWQSGKGLSEYLMGDDSIPELLIKTEIERLSILPSGSIQDNPTELIGSKKMETLVQELKTRYNDRYIIFDSTPLLATSESEVLSKLVDGVIVVVRAGITPRETLKQAISSLEKEKILGFVLNDLQFRTSGLFSRYFGSDGDYYKYGYDKKKKSGKKDKGKKLSLIQPDE